MPKRVKGISIVSCSPNSKYVAFGSLRGKLDCIYQCSIPFSSQILDHMP